MTHEDYNLGENLKKLQGLSIHICEIKDHTLKWHTHILHKVLLRYRVQISTYKLNNRSQDSLWDLDIKVTLKELHACVRRDKKP